MFVQLYPEQKRRFSVMGSVAVHAIFLAWLLHSPKPIFVAPSYIVHGENGTAVTTLYWTPQGTSDEASKVEKLTWAKPPKVKAKAAEKTAPPQKAVEETDDRREAHLTPGPPAGTPYGSLSYGTSAGWEVRPALRLSGSEPIVDADDLNGAEGSEVIEITIDEGGNIVSKVIIASLGPMVDAKVMAALANWRFHPATRDGVAIPSKQDVSYHYPVRR
jgi:TonB family protein